ncbi:MAG: Gfo/Idh/MocA family oxidoreductase [Candidatus Latescibacteria bacterium]|nr:Gfo/Idh/MocA family oxidoreductase [Candidatus Latescibacterota bacterium]
MTPINVGIIGAGYRGVNTLAERIVEIANETGLRVTAIHDTRQERLDETQIYLQDQFQKQGIDLAIAKHANANALIKDPNVDLVMVTTPQSAHKDPTITALESGKKVYLDKPIAHTLEDAIAIIEAEKRANNPMILGFTRRYEAPWRKAYELLKDGVIGELHMLQIRDIIPFHTFFHRWHRKRQWSGDAINDKSSHHMDVFNWFTGSRATKITGFGGQRVFTPKEDAPIRCLECDLDCPYRATPTRGQIKSPEELSLTGDSWINANDEYSRVDTCVYLPGADSLDHANVQIAYENGMIASLFLSFFGPKADDQETLELVGTKGRIILTRHTGKLDVVTDYGQTHEIIDCKKDDFSSSHFGADLELVRELQTFYNGAPPLVSAYNGYEATRMIVASLQSIDSGGETVHMNHLPSAQL